MENELAKIVAVFAVAGLMATGPVVYAVSEGDNPENGKGAQFGTGQEFMDGLNLDEEQKEKFKALQESDKAIMEKIKKKTQELDTMVAEPGMTRAADVSDLIEEVSTLQKQMLFERIERLFAIKEILTPEQFAKMQKMDKERMSTAPGRLVKKNPGPDQD